jgi:hypothetical protein
MYLVVVEHFSLRASAEKGGGATMTGAPGGYALRAA